MIEVEARDRKIWEDYPSGPQFYCRVVVLRDGEPVYDKPWYYLLRPETDTEEIQEELDEFKEELREVYEERLAGVDPEAIG